jgi:arylsulfatase A-like enzyme
VVIGESGQGGPQEMHPRARSLMAHQRAVAERPEFSDTVRFVPTRHIWHDTTRFEGAYHWHGNARNFFELGDAMGEAMLALVTGAPRPQPPNVVLVMTDDQGWGDVGYHGHPRLRTPHLDALAEEGVRLERFYAAAAVCSPTRGSVLTGRHPARYGIDGANDGHLPAAEAHLTKLLAARGYRTGFFGKWHLGVLTNDVVDSNRGGREKQAGHYAPPWERGFDVTFATEAKVPTFDPMVSAETGEPYGTAYWTGPGQRVPDEELQGDDSALVMDQALAFLRETTAAERPFFAVVWLHAPHKPVVAGPEHLALYEDVEDVELRHYYGCLSAVDDQVGRLRESLRELGVADDTLLVFCSDNGPENRVGPGITGGLRGRKRDLLEGGVRVPGLIEWPAGLTGGREFHGPAGTIDLLPTVLDAVGANPYPALIDGMSLLPRLAGRGRTPSYGFLSGRRRAYHQGPWKIHSSDAGETWSIYDVAADPAEASDLAAAQPERLAAMVEAFTAWEASVGKDREDAPEASR